MYAVIASGGKQYKVRPGDIVRLEKLATEKGKAMKFDQVLFASEGKEGGKTTLGQPTIKGAQVSAEVVAQGRGDKLIVFKMKRRKQYRRKQGHRQEQTEVLITGIEAGAVKASLSAADKKSAIEKWMTQLTPKGPARTTKTLGSRVRLKGDERQGRQDRRSKTAAKKKVATKTVGKKAAKKVKATKTAAKKKARKVQAKTAAKKKTTAKKTGGAAKAKTTAKKTTQKKA